MHDEINLRQHFGLRHEPLDVHIVGKFTERGRLAFRTDRDQDLDVKRCDLSDRPAEHLNRAEGDRAQCQVGARCAEP